MLTWTSTGTQTVEIHVNSPGGLTAAISGAGVRASAIGSWVKEGTAFYLQDVSGGKPLTPDNTLATTTAHVSVCVRTGSITATPNPIIVCDGSGLGQTTLNWTSAGVMLRCTGVRRGGRCSHNRPLVPNPRRRGRW